jgi:hypothetical protein
MQLPRMVWVGSNGPSRKRRKPTAQKTCKLLDKVGCRPQPPFTSTITNLLLSTLFYILPNGSTIVIMPIDYSMDLDIDAYLRKRRTNVHNLCSHVAREQGLMLSTNNALVLKDAAPQLSTVSDESEDSSPSVEQMKPAVTKAEEDRKPVLEQNAAASDAEAAPKKEEEKKRTGVLLSTQKAAEQPASALASYPYSMFVATQVAQMQPEARVISPKDKEVEAAAAAVSSKPEPESIEIELSIGDSYISAVNSIKEGAEPIAPVEVEKEEEKVVQNIFSGGEESAFASVQLAIDNANKALAENSAPVLVTEEDPRPAIDSPAEAIKEEQVDESSVPDKFAVLVEEDVQEEALVGEKSALLLTNEDVAALSSTNNIVGFERELSTSSRSNMVFTFDPEPAKMLDIKVGSPEEPLLSCSEMHKDSPTKVAHPVTNWQEINITTPVMLKDDGPVLDEQTQRDMFNASNCAVGEAEEDFFESAGCASMSEAMEPAREGVERVKLLLKGMTEFFQKVDDETTGGKITDAIVPAITQEVHLLLKQGGSEIVEAKQPASQEAKMILTEAVEFLFPPFNNNSQTLPTTVESPVAPVTLKL